MFRKLRIALALLLLSALTCCSATAALRLPKNITKIGAGAFSGVSAGEILLPDTLKEINDSAFDDFSSVTAVVFGDSYAQKWCAWNNVKHYTIRLLSDSACEIVSYSAASGHLSIPSKLAGYRVTAIAAEAFYGNTAITGLTLPDSLTSIGAKAFADCTALAGTILVPDALVSIAADAFSGCPAKLVYPQDVIAFNSVTLGASSTRAYMYAVAKAAASGSFSETGLSIWDSDGTLVAESSKSSTTTGASKALWFDVFSDTGASLKPNTRYTYRMYVTYKGSDYWSKSQSFTTAASIKADSTLTTAAILRNMEACTDTSVIPSGKRDAMLIIAGELLQAGYTPAFAASVIANVRYEGSFGKFENSNYVTNPSSKPSYLVYMDELYDYRSKYSGKYLQRYQPVGAVRIDEKAGSK